MSKSQPPKKTTQSDDQFSPETYTHPAYGLISLSTVQGGACHLFGSDLTHSTQVVIRISAASLMRDGSSDITQPIGKPIIELGLSHSQFARFIMSSGQGCGTPVTLRRAPNPSAISESIPAIQPIQTKTEMIQKEVANFATQQTKVALQKIQELTDYLESGKSSKKEMQQKLFNLKCIIGNLPGNLEHAVEMAQEAIDISKNAALTELEAAHQMHLVALGSQAINSASDIVKKIETID